MHLHKELGRAIERASSANKLRVYLHHVQEVLLLDEPLVQFVFLGPELGWVRVCATQVLEQTQRNIVRPEIYFRRDQSLETC